MSYFKAAANSLTLSILSVALNLNLLFITYMIYVDSSYGWNTYFSTYGLSDLFFNMNA